MTETAQRHTAVYLHAHTPNCTPVLVIPQHSKMEIDLLPDEELLAPGGLMQQSLCKIISLWNHTVKTMMNINQGKE